MRILHSFYSLGSCLTVMKMAPSVSTISRAVVQYAVSINLAHLSEQVETHARPLHSTQ